MPHERDIIDEFVAALSGFVTDFVQDKVEEHIPQAPRAPRKVKGKAPKAAKIPKPPKLPKVKVERLPPLLYDELEVSPRASAETIKAAYLSLSKRFHPDVAKHKGAAERMARINAAHDVLSDPVKREEYDRKLRGGGE